jgi:hypothetical protein
MTNLERPFGKEPPTTPAQGSVPGRVVNQPTFCRLPFIVTRIFAILVTLSMADFSYARRLAKRGAEAVCDVYPRRVRRRRCAHWLSVSGANARPRTAGMF